MFTQNLIIEKLKSQNLRLSKGKIAILEFLYSKKRPCSAQEILSSLDKIKLNKSSLYRAMDILKKHKLIQDFVDLKGIMRFEIFSKKHHHHIQCNSCQTTECLESFKELEKVCHSFKDSFAGFKNIHHHIDFAGLCQNCSNKNS